jgi:hypothetical protein
METDSFQWQDNEFHVMKILFDNTNLVYLAEGWKIIFIKPNMKHGACKWFQQWSPTLA